MSRDYDGEDRGLFTLQDYRTGIGGRLCAQSRSH